MDCRPFGDRGVLLSALSDAERASLIQVLNKSSVPGCQECVPGHNSILLVGAEIEVVRQWIRGMGTKKLKRAKPARCHTIEVIYNGEDLDAVAATCGMSVREVIQLHSAPTYTVRMMGFSPGFPYLDGLDSRLHIARRQSPRNYISPGSVAIGGPHAGIYSVASPGGWHLLGQTQIELFSLEAAKAPNPDPDRVFALSVGDRVRFQPSLTG